MSTHAAIIQATPTGDYRGIYVHSDGYREHTGRILQEHYATEEAVDALIDLGDLSGIDNTPETCIAYQRDRGEAKRIVGGANLEQVAKRIDWDYLYLWEDGEWHIFTHREFDEELASRQAWEIKKAEHTAGWDPNP